jgi:tight adherence protein C
VPDLTTITLIVTAVAGGFAVALLAFGLHNVFVRRILDAAEQEEQANVAQGLKAIVFRRMIAMNRGLIRQDYRDWVRRQLIAGGDPREISPDDFVAIQELSAAGFLIFGAIFLLVVKASWLWVVAFLAVGAGYPVLWLRDKVTKRHMAITRALPYNLDLLTLAVEAGLDFQAGVAKVCEKGKQGPLVDELKFMLSQLKIGKTREEALKLMAERICLPSVSAFVNALIQADRMGASLGKVLRIQSTQLRQDRSQRAEKLANEAPVKMLFPLIFCIFPTVFLVLFGPIVFQFLFGGQF